MNTKVQEALNLLIEFEVPKAQQNERTALCLLALLNITREKKWKDATNPLIGITPMMEFARINYDKKYAPNTRETFRRFSMHQLVQAGIALYNPDEPSRPVNSPKAVYQISPAALKVVREFENSYTFKSQLMAYKKKTGVLVETYARERKMVMVSVKLKDGMEIKLSPGEHNTLIKDIIEKMAPRFLPGSLLVYIGDTGDKWGYFDKELAKEIGINVDQHGKMPDVVFYVPDKKWLILVESVTSHGPVDSKRLIELVDLFRIVNSEKIYITAFQNKQILAKYATEIAWETEVWLSENPSHMIHFNGSKFMGPY